MTRKKTISATLTEKIAIMEILHERLHAVEGTDLFRYEDGWSDEMVAIEVNIDLNANHASKVRAELFGKLFKQSRPTIVSRRLADRVTVLEGQFQRLLDWSLGGDTRTHAEILGNVESNGADTHPDD